MSGSVNITNLMVEDHSKIVELLDRLEESIEENLRNAKNIFEKFEWNLEKHIFVEEKIIFTKYEPEDVSEGYKMLPKLTKQHNYIDNELRKMRREIMTKNNNPSDFYDFKQYLIKHREFEEEKVYPKLDDSLNEEQKKAMAGKINEII